VFINMIQKSRICTESIAIGVRIFSRFGNGGRGCVGLYRYDAFT
jgi:hypothetical protein